MRFQGWFLNGAAALVLAGCSVNPAEPPFSALDNLPSGSLAARRAAGAYTPTTNEVMANLLVDKSHAGQPIDLTGYKMTFRDEFNRMSVTDGNGNGPWYSPVHSDFGSSKFLPPRKGQGPVFVRKGKLVIQLYQEKGKWISSLVQTVNKDGQGFAQQYGYFEMRAKLPPEKGSWGGLWLHSHPALTGPRVPQTEIDVIEAYGGDKRGHHAAMHIWPKKPPLPGDIETKASKGVYTKVDGLFDGYRTHGVLITPDFTAFYYENKELFRVPTMPEFKTPQYVLLDLALLPKLKDEAKGLMEFEVDYVRVWQKE